MKPTIKPAANLTNTVDAGRGVISASRAWAPRRQREAGLRRPAPAAIQAYVNLAAGVCAERQSRRPPGCCSSTCAIQLCRESKGLEPYREPPSCPPGFRCYGLSFDRRPDWHYVARLEQTIQTKGTFMRNEHFISNIVSYRKRFISL